jgi:hypothetical protein
VQGRYTVCWDSLENAESCQDKTNFLSTA